MKKLFFRYTTGFIPFIVFCCGAFAQDNLSGAGVKDLAVNTKAKPHHVLVNQATSPVSINAKALKDFTKTYKHSSNASWFELRGGYLAKFEKDGVSTKVYYDNKGRLVGNIQSYFENKLDPDIRHQIKSNYYDHSIFYIQEVTVGNQKAFLVKLEGKNDWKTVRLADNEMEEIESFQKSK